MKKKIIDLNVVIKDLDDKEIESGKTLGKLVAHALVSEPQGDVLKFYDWAKSFNKGELVELDRSDYETLKTFIKDHKTLTILAKGQILPLLENDKTISKKN